MCSVFRWKVWPHCWKVVEFLLTHFPNTNKWTSTQVEERAHAEQNHQENEEPVDTDHIQTAWSHTVLMAMILAASEQNIFVHLGFHQWQIENLAMSPCSSIKSRISCLRRPWSMNLENTWSTSAILRTPFTSRSLHHFLCEGSWIRRKHKHKFNLFPARDNRWKPLTFPYLGLSERIEATPHGMHWISINI